MIASEDHLEADVDLEVERLLGGARVSSRGPGDRQELEHERTAQRRDVRQLIKLLPPGLRPIVMRIQNPYYALRVLDRTREAATAEAISKGEPNRHGRVSNAVLKRVLAGWGTSSEKRRWLQSAVRDAMSSAHLERRTDDLAAPVISPVKLPAGSTWNARGDLKLGVPNGLEAGPDLPYLAFASLITGQATLDDDSAGAEDAVPDELIDSLSEDVSLEVTQRARVLQLGACTRNLGVLIDGLEVGVPEGRGTRLVEVEAFDWERASKCTQAPRFSWASAAFSGTFDFLVLTPPCPAAGIAAQLRGLYMEGARNEMDPGRKGPRAWTEIVTAALAAGVQSLRPGGLVLGLLPMGIRVSHEDASGEYRRGATYLDGPEVLDWVDPAFEVLGLKVLRDIAVTEIEVKRSPWVDRARPPYRLLVAEKEVFGA